MFKKYIKLWITLGIFMLLSPLGLIAAGTAFGEWGTDQLTDKVGFIPAGLAKSADLWDKSPLRGYGIPGMDGSFAGSVSGYIISTVVGVVLVVLLVSLVSRGVKD